MTITAIIAFTTELCFIADVTSLPITHAGETEGFEKRRFIRFASRRTQKR
jgi:hypothetical protein